MPAVISSHLPSSQGRLEDERTSQVPITPTDAVLLRGTHNPNPEKLAIRDGNISGGVRSPRSVMDAITDAH